MRLKYKSLCALYTKVYEPEVQKSMSLKYKSLCALHTKVYEPYMQKSMSLKLPMRRVWSRGTGQGASAGRPAVTRPVPIAAVRADQDS